MLTYLQLASFIIFIVGGSGLTLLGLVALIARPSRVPKPPYLPPRPNGNS